MTNPNSNEVYHNEIKGPKETGQDNLILSAFVAIGKPATARMVQKYISKILEIELEVNVMSRSVNNLHSGKLKEPRIIKVKDDECEVTKRKATYYEAILQLKLL